MKKKATIISVLLASSLIIGVLIIFFGNQGDTPDARILWTFDDESMFYYSVPAIDNEGNVYIGSAHKWRAVEDGLLLSDHYYLYSLFPNGSLRWKFDSGRREIRGGPVIGLNSMIYFVAENHSDHQVRTRDELLALNHDGTLNWSSIIWTDLPVDPGGHGMDYCTPAIDADGIVYVMGENLTSFYGLNGTVRWSNNINPDFWGSPSIQGETIYIPARGLLAYDLNGTFKWRFDPPGEPRSVHKPAIDSDGAIYFGDENNHVHAVFPNGTTKWTFNIPVQHGQARGNPAIDDDGTIYIGTKADTSSTFFAINPDGSLKWQYASPLRDVYSSPAIGNDGSIFFASEDRKLFCVEKTNGRLKWSVQLRGDVTWSSVALNSDGIAFIGDMSGRLYAVQTECTGLNECPWPRWGRFNTGTANS